jgi:hypothetical protein
VTIDSAGAGVYVAGYVTGALPGFSRLGDTDAFLRKYDDAGVEQWTQQFGSGGADVAHSAIVDGNGGVYVAGYTHGAFPGQTNLGAYDIFVRNYDGSGTAQSTQQLGSTFDDYAYSVSLDPSGALFLGGYTDGTLPGQTSPQVYDAFVIRLLP